MSIRVTTDGLEDAIRGILDDYEKDVRMSVADTVKDVAKKGAKIVNAAASTVVNGSKYSKSWKSRIDKSNSFETQATIYSTEYRLAHLLENGHVKVLWGRRTGGFVPGRIHIAHAEEQIVEELTNRVTKEL